MSRIILSLGIFFLQLTSLHAQTFNGTGGAIPDGGAQTCFDITVAAVGTINGTYGLASVCLNITHTWDSDLEIYLKAPDGTIIPLSIQNGVGGVNYTNTCFTATAATVITAGTPPYTGNFRPEGNLGFANNGQNADGTWSLCIQDLFATDAGSLVNWSLLFNNTPAPPPVIPANDDPCNAIPLTVGAACSYSNYTNENATGTTGVPAPGCSSYLGGDVWFSVVVPAGGALIFDTQTGVVTDGGMAIYSGTCNALTLIACDDDASTNGLMPMINAAGLTPGSTLWIRVWEYGNDNNGTFGICVTTPPPPPTNDDPCNAFILPVNNSCNFAYYTNVGATSTTGVPAPGCGNYQGADVWFTVTVPPGGSIIFDSNTGTITDGDMAIYSGGTCAALTLIQCDDLSSANGLMPSITLTGQTPGATLWVRFWGYGANNTGTFQLCASIPPPPTVQDCPAAIAICQNIYNEPISYSGTGSIGNEINPANSCLTAGERADVWYTFTVQTSGNLNFTITPNNATEDYDWAVYNLTNATCADIYNNAALNVSCNFSSTAGTTGPTGGSALTTQGAGGTPYNAVIPVVAGQTYVINVSNYSLSTNGYSINFGASTASIFDNVPPHLQSINSAISCGGNQISINFSENILCSTIQNADFTITGPGGPYTVTNWASATCTAGATYANNVVLTLSPVLTTNGNYQLCLTNASGSVTDLCGNVAPPGCLDFTIASTVPTFAPIAPICNGSTPPVLPTTSLNGFTGTWSPATVSNTATATYTFTPNIGQCATPTTLTVTVTAAGTVPTFAAVAAICSGSAAPVLPTTSL
ncbi:MAG: proprotein convertase P-domain-containing protein, partial [Ferruginibacter sp.]